MTSTRWSRRRARKAVQRGLTRFEVRLRSACPGIGFTARITATVLTEPPYPSLVEEIAGAVRTTLRDAASKVSKTCDPADLASARDICGQHLGRVRQLPTDPLIEFKAKLTLDLLPDDRAAVAALLAAQRRQAVTDTLRLQKTGALAAELAHPAALLARWIERDNADWSQLVRLADDANVVAEVFARYRPEDERSVEHEAVEVLREFLASFPDHTQKRMCTRFWPPAWTAPRGHTTPRRHKPWSTGTPPPSRRASREGDGWYLPRPRRRGGPVSTSVWRWLLSPWTSWRAWQLARASQGNLSFDAAWRRTRLERHPDEMPYQEHGHIATDNEIEDPRAKQQW